MKVVHKLLVWALRDRSYKTKAEDWAAGHRLHLYQGVYLGFCLASSNGLKRLDGFKGFKRFKRFKGLKGFKRFKGSF